MESNEKRNIRSHYKMMVNGVLSEKKGYKTEKEALHAAFVINTLPQTIHKFVAYKCSKCDNWHIGRNSTVLTDEMKEDYKKKLNTL